MDLGKNNQARRIALLLSMAILLMPVRSFAVDRDVRAVLTTSAYGAAAGTALGLVSWPLTGKAKNIFLGSAIGLVLGVVAGIYFISNRDDPDNPLRADGLSPWARETAPSLPPTVMEWEEIHQASLTQARHDFSSATPTVLGVQVVVGEF